MTRTNRRGQWGFATKLVYYAIMLAFVVGLTYLLINWLVNGNDEYVAKRNFQLVLNHIEQAEKTGRPVALVLHMPPEYQLASYSQGSEYTYEYEYHHVAKSFALDTAKGTCTYQPDRREVNLDRSPVPVGGCLVEIGKEPWKDEKTKCAYLESCRVTEPANREYWTVKAVKRPMTAKNCGDDSCLCVLKEQKVIKCQKLDKQTLGIAYKHPEPTYNVITVSEDAITMTTS